MKKILGIAFLVIFVFNNSFSQRIIEQKVRVGLSVSPAIAWFTKVDGGSNESYSNDGARLNFGAGLNIDIPFLTKHISILTGVNIDYCGGKIQSQNSQAFINTFKDAYKNIYQGLDTAKPNTFNVLSKYKFQYIEIPFMLKMKTPEIGAFTYFLQAGLGTSINIGAKADFEFTNITNAHETYNISDKSVSDHILFLRESLLVGAGFEFSIASGTSLIFTANFNNGFINSLRKTDLIQKSNLVSISAGVLF
ncbi:MAG: outer membrane beta-barrel protein [Bacteroidota bacterium]|nr:outer membrane beta-barrel protein [Bacteroidota bacterium]